MVARPVKNQLTQSRGSDMAELGSVERTVLARGIEKIRGILEARGFHYAPGDQSVSSGGSFAVGFFRRGDLEIGLIVRSGGALGCPNYSEQRDCAGHEELIQEIDPSAEAQLVAGEFVHFRSRVGGDAFDALRVDLETVILPALDASDAEFRQALRRAVNVGRLRIGLPPLKLTD